MKKTRKPIRLQKYDYANGGFYYVTICTHNKKHWFGEIQNWKMILSKVGDIANRYWQQIPNHFENVDLKEFVVMPNHIHGLIKIKNNHDKKCRVVACNDLSNNNEIFGQKSHFLNKRMLQCNIPTK